MVAITASTRSIGSLCFRLEPAMGLWRVGDKPQVVGYGTAPGAHRSLGRSSDRHPCHWDRRPPSWAASTARRSAVRAAPAFSPTRLEALFVISITLGLRPGELRKLTWDHVDLNRGVIHVWRSASKTGDTKTPKSKRSLELPKRAIAALTVHKARQAKERQTAGEAWHDNDLVFCHENGTRTRPTRSTGASRR
jgi:integrase